MTSSESQMAEEITVVEALGALNLAPDGGRFFLNLVCEDGHQVDLSFPTDCLKTLIMTLPQLMRQALQAQYRDESLRLVYPAEGMRIEQSSDANTFIVTFATVDGFEISLGLTWQQMTNFNLVAAELSRKGVDSSPAKFS
jgi:hypothetical protein